jgi:chitinase
MENATNSSGRIFQLTSGGPDITGFDPARDKLDLGPVTVHNGIIVDTPSGVGIMNPWSGEIAIVVGVSLGQLTIDSFVPVINDHLRECLSGALAWEHGVVPQAHTVYARSHEIGQIDRVAFNAATDTVDFRYFGTREQIYMTDNPEGVVISNSGTGQALILLGVTTAELKAENFIFYYSEAREDRVALQLGFSSVPDSQIKSQGVPIAGTNNWPTVAGNGTPPSGQAGVTTVIDWHYGTNTVLNFDPSKDKLDFGWFKASEFSVTEVDGSTVISIDSNKQTYVLTGVTLYELDHNNIAARDTTAVAEWRQLIDSATAPAALPQLSVGNGTLVEGNAGKSQMTFTVTLSQASTSPVSVGYTTMNGAAIAGQDYASIVGSLTFAAGETTKTVSVDILGDTLIETNETFSLVLSSPAGATIASGSAMGTIVNDDIDTQPAVLPAISIADLSTREGNGEHNHFMFSVTLDKASSEPVTVQYKTVDGSATDGSDYKGGTGTVTFAPGITSQTIHVDIAGDTVVEGDETFTVMLSSPVGGTIADGSATGIIVNDDVAAPPVLPSLSVGDATVVEGNSGTANLLFTVSLSKAATGPVTVQYGTADGTATAGSDYTAKSGTLTFAAGETSKTISVAVKGDTVVEANEALALTLSSATGATIADGSAIGTIGNDDVAAPAGPAAVAYTVNDNWGAGFTANMQVAAGSTALNGWTVEFDATFTISNIWNAQIISHVGNHYVIKNMPYNGTVGANKDTGFGFQATPGSGGTAATSFTINGTPSGGGGTPAPVLPSLSVGDATVVEGNSGTANLLFTVSLSKAATGPVTVQYGTADGTATAGSDYTAKSGTLTFAAGETSKTISVAVKGDTVVEANEALALTLSSATGATIADGSAIGTIGNDDVAAPPPVLPSVSVSDAVRAEGNSGTGMLDFTVSLSQAATGPVTVQYGTADGTATAGSDYTAKSGTLTFAAGETSKTISVTVKGDTAVEANETLNLKLSSASGATIADGSGMGTITNDDGAGGLGAQMAVVNSWGAGFNAAVTIHNDGGAISGWQLEIETDSQITSIWNAEIVSHSADGYVIRNAGWNGTVATDADVSFGFTASGAADLARFDLLI